MDAETPARSVDQIEADITKVKGRLDANRTKIKNEEGKMRPDAFNYTNSEIHKDSLIMDELLAERFDAMVWDNPHLLALTSGPDGSSPESDRNRS